MMTLEKFLEEWHDGNDRIQVHTSGSTGTPKLMWVEKSRMVASARMTCDFLGLHPGDTALLCMPLDYIAGKMMVVRSLHRQLQLTAIEPSGHPLAHTDIPFTFAAMVPLQVWNSLQVDEEREKLRQIRHLIIGGGAIDDSLAEELKDFPNAVWSTYGMTETLSHIALRRLNGLECSDWYTPFEGVDVSLSADGCLVVDAPAVCPERLVTNDLSVISSISTPAGQRPCFRIIGRRDNVICTGGVKIQIEEVERKLRPHLSVPFMISRRKDEKFGEIVVMLTESPDIKKCKTLCESLLQKYERPRLYITVDKLPLTETGKPARAAAEALIAGKEV